MCERERRGELQQKVFWGDGTLEAVGARSRRGGVRAQTAPDGCRSGGHLSGQPVLKAWLRRGAADRGCGVRSASLRVRG